MDEIQLLCSWTGGFVSVNREVCQYVAWAEFNGGVRWNTYKTIRDLMLSGF